jgi:hypothetical protein
MTGDMPLFRSTWGCSLAVQPKEALFLTSFLASFLALAVIAVPHAAIATGANVVVKKGARQHLDFAGKPCLSTEGSARPLTSNPRIMNHTVSFDNHCSDRIKLKVCYADTEDCTDVEVPGYGRKDQVIGVFPALQLFRYEVKEQF